GTSPEFMCTGKASSDGAIPLGAMIAREEMADAFFRPPEAGVQFAHGHTFTGTPMDCEVGIAVVDEMVEHKLDEKAVRLGDYLASRLECLKKYGVVREVRGKGVLRGVELVKDTRTMQPFPELGKAMKRTALQNGIVMRIDPSWCAVCPPLIADEPAIDEMCGLIEKSLTGALALVKK